MHDNYLRHLEDLIDELTVQWFVDVSAVTGVIKLEEMCSCKYGKTNGTDFPSVIKMKFGVTCNLAPANYVQVIHSLLHTGILICVQR